MTENSELRKLKNERNGIEYNNVHCRATIFRIVIKVHVSVHAVVLTKSRESNSVDVKIVAEECAKGLKPYANCSRNTKLSFEENCNSGHYVVKYELGTGQNRSHFGPKRDVYMTNGDTE